MQVLKFGGVSVLTPQAVKNTANIIRSQFTKPTLVVLSAMGKMTNALEILYQSSLENRAVDHTKLQIVRDFHFQMLRGLFPCGEPALEEVLNQCMKDLEKQLEKSLRHPDILTDYTVYDFFYDQIISIGELLSTHIMAAYLAACQLPVVWMDARKIIHTDHTFREGKVQWKRTIRTIKNQIKPLLTDGKLVLTQGFLGGNRNTTTTLGREGSDYSAAVFAFGLDASEMIIWKDVEGLLNADPKFFAETQVLRQIPYSEAIELAYYGATVIHHKTIKPLENKNIPLRVKSFLQPNSEGSLILQTTEVRPAIPSYIVKRNQVLISISPRDFSFIAEENLSVIYGMFAQLGMKINLMQNTALLLCICTDWQEQKWNLLKERLGKEFRLSAHENLDLITVRRYTEDVIEKVVQGRTVVLEQRNRITAQLLVENLTD